MRVLLTGSSGWLGRHLAPLLVDEGHEVIGLDVVPGAATRVVGSVANRDLAFQTVAHFGIEAVIHSGGLHQPDLARFDRRAFVDTNVTGTLNLLEAAIAAGHPRLVFTSTTSLMVRGDVRAGAGGAGAWWMDEAFGPLAPRNVYGVTKLAAENLCRVISADSGMAVAILRTGRFFPEDDDVASLPSGANLKANEFLNRRLTVDDAARAHLAALERIEGCETFVISAPPPFARAEALELATDAQAVLARHYPDAAEVYARAGWALPERVERVYDPGKAERLLGWRARTDFGVVLDALREGGPMPFAHDPSWISPVLGTG